MTTDGGDGFSDNIFSDLAPLLALFGEQFTKQFMSQSMGWADNFIFAMAPLGIITGIVSAIRVGGPTWLKAIIGRAMENRATAEAELMSSTSDEVCELWNRQQIVRIIGSAPIREFIILLPCDGNALKEDDPDNQPICYTLEEAIKKNHLDRYEPEWFNRKTFLRSQKGIQKGRDLENAEKDPKAECSRPIIIQPDNSSAPNVSLNLHNRSGRGELRVVAAVGTVLQFGVLVYSGFATHHPGLKFEKKGNPVSGHAFSLVAIGTTVLVCGMLICSHIVERSTKEVKYRVRDGMKARIIWLQRNQSVSDQVFGSFAIFAKGERKFITTSRREDKHIDSIKGNDPTPKDNESQIRTEMDNTMSTFTEILTTVGTLVSLCGFVVQFVGLRGLHWSATVAQLGAILVMTILRAWVRRGIAERPAFQPLPSEFEVDWLAAKMGDPTTAVKWETPASSEKMPLWKQDCDNWNTMLLREPSERDDELVDSDPAVTSRLHRVMEIRKHLARNARWPGPASDEAISVATSIGIVCNMLFPSAYPGVPDNDNNWLFRTVDDQTINFKLTRRMGKWEADEAEIEAALSLWLFAAHVEEQRKKDSSVGSLANDDKWLRAKGAPKRRSLWFLAPYTRTSERDFKWWIPDIAVKIVEKGCADSDLDSNDSREVHPWAVGLTGPGFSNQPESSPAIADYKVRDLPEEFHGALEETSALAVISDAPLRLLFAQNLLSAFTFAAAQKLKRPIFGETVVNPMRTAARDDDDTGWQSFTLQNSKLSKMAQDIQDTGLGTVEEAYLSIISSLSMANKLPEPNAVVSWTREHARSHERAGNWEQVGYTYLWLFQMSMAFPAKSHIYVKATAILLDYLRSLTLTIKLWVEQGCDGDRIDDLEDLEFKTKRALESANTDILSGLLGLLKAQKRDWKCDFAEASNLDKEDELCETFGYTELHRLDENDIGRLRNLSRIHRSEADVFGWTPLHYAAANRRSWAVDELLGNFADANSKDLCERTPLHYASEVQTNTDIVWQLLEKGADVGAQSRDGVTSLHCAAKAGSLEAVKSLVEAGADVNIPDALRRAPLHWAAFKGHTEVIRYLGPAANGKLRDLDGRSPLHLAVIAGHEVVARLLIENGADHEIKDKDGHTPLLLAAAKGHGALSRLLIESGANKETTNRFGQTPLYQAASRGHEAVTRLLIKSGADMETKDKSEQTPLHQAVWNGHKAVTRLLIESGADKEAKDENERTPLYLAASRGYEAVTRLLVESGAEPKNESGWTPLHQAAAGNHVAVARLLIGSGADKEARDGSGQTPLHCAASNGRKAVTRLLIGSGVDMEIKDKSEKTPLYLAVFYGKYAVTRLLIESGADKDVKDELGRTSLHQAASRGHEAVVNLLIESGADKEAKDVYGWTPLRIATHLGYEAVERLLIETGADEETKDESGQTP